MMIVRSDSENVAMLEGLGYYHVTLVDGMWCGIRRQMFTVGVFIDMDESFVAGRYCFDTAADAEYFLEEWNGRTVPVVGEDGCTAIKWKRGA